MLAFKSIGKIHHAQDQFSQFSVDYTIKWYEIVLIYKVKKKHVSTLDLSYNQK